MKLALVIVPAASIAAWLTCSSAVFAQQRFDSAEDAAKALINAAASHNSAQLQAIIGPQSRAILTSGNTQQDQAEQSEFARLAQARHNVQVSAIDHNRAVLTIGDEDWPFPVPICKINGKWQFDASQTPDEMHARRIGADELDAIEICHGYVDAQKKYAAEDRDRDGMLEYAPHLMSSPGRQDGLYSKTASSSFIPEGMAAASFSGTGGAAKPYHGYYFRILDSQGTNAPGGAHRYLVNGKMIGGFALVAWPAKYGVTGVHTFIVNQDGTVFEKDIAPAAGKPFAPPMRYDPDPTWTPVE